MFLVCSPCSHQVGFLINHHFGKCIACVIIVYVQCAALICKPFTQFKTDICGLAQDVNFSKLWNILGKSLALGKSRNSPSSSTYICVLTKSGVKHHTDKCGCLDNFLHDLPCSTDEGCRNNGVAHSWVTRVHSWHVDNGVCRILAIYKKVLNAVLSILGLSERKLKTILFIFSAPDDAPSILIERESSNNITCRVCTDR